MSFRFLTALPVYNEAPYVNSVLDEVRRYSEEVLVVDDGSTDETAALLAARGDVRVETHGRNRGYGAALRTAFDFARQHRFDVIVTIDCDGQHEPQRIPVFVGACQEADIVSGSRYLQQFAGDSAPPPDRLAVNRKITDRLNELLHLNLTDSFCGFKAYRVAALEQLDLTEDGYAMPLELWVQAACAGLRVIELPVPLIYLDQDRTFGGVLDDADSRLNYYERVIDCAIAKTESRRAARPIPSVCGHSGG